MNIKREQATHLLSVLNDSSSPHNVLLIQGARQVGKSTLIKQVLSHYDDVVSYNLEEELSLRDDIDQTKNFSDFETILKLRGLNTQSQQILFIDEAQESEKLGGYIRFMKEQWSNTRVILSGSSMTRLFREDQRVPVGRAITLKLNPLSFYEFLGALKLEPLQEVIQNSVEQIDISPIIHQKLLENFDAYLTVGGLPEVVLQFAANRDFKTLRRSILLLQQEDFIRKTNFEDRDLFLSALRGVANYLGLPAKYTHISESSREAKKIVTIMQAWNLIEEVEQKGFASTSTFLPKRYCYDIGIAQQVRNMPFPTLSILNSIDPALRTQLGGLFENVAYLSLTNHNMNQIDLTGWKDNESQSEVDFIWQEKTNIPIECKAALKVTPRHYTNLKKYLLKSGTKIGFLVSAAPFEATKQNGLTLINLPIYLCRPEIIKALASQSK